MKRNSDGTFAKGSDPHNKGVPAEEWMEDTSNLFDAEDGGKNSPFVEGHSYWDNPKTKENWVEEGEVLNGTKHSELTKKKISASHQGIDLSDWDRFKSDERERLRNSQEWTDWRKSVFKRDNYTCQDCGDKGCELHPHHIKPKSLYKDIMFDVENGVTLCSDCHAEKHKNPNKKLKYTRGG